MTISTFHLRMAHRCCYALAILLALSLSSPVASDQAVQSLSGIEDVAKKFVRTHLGQGTNTDVRVSGLDQRLRLSACAEPLRAFLPSGTQLRNNGTVGVRCPGSSPWTIYVPIQVRFYGDVVVLKRPLARGDSIEAHDISLVRRELGALNGQYVSALEEVVGMVARRPLGAESVINPSMISAPEVIKRGERVSIVARRGAFTVRGSGTALGNGSVGEIVRVRNTRSKRTIEGIVAAPGVVEVRL